MADESRHAAVLERYIEVTNLTRWPESASLERAYHQLLKSDARGIGILGMQVLIEGSALAALVGLTDLGVDALLGQILRYIISDEARHVGLGVIVEQEAYQDLSNIERNERDSMAHEMSFALQTRLRPTAVSDYYGVDSGDLQEFYSGNPDWIAYESLISRKLSSLMAKVRDTT
jgi:hypothetical protein